MEQLLRFDFGNDFVPHDEGFIKIERLFLSARYLWVNELRNRWNCVEECSPFRDIVYGNEGEFRIGLPQGEYRLDLHFFDPQKTWVPFPVCISCVQPHAPRHSGVILNTTEISAPKGEKLLVSVSVRHPGGVLAVSFPQSFFVSGLDVYGPENTVLETIYPEAPADTLPTRETVLQNSDCNPSAMLETACEWFLRHRLPDGFIGDFEEGKRLWYTASYPIRTLLAGYELLGNRAYLTAATAILDLLVTEQMPEGGFTQAYRAQATASLSAQELQAVRETNWMNLADVGSMVAALAVACRSVSGGRRECYCAAVQRYLNDWALRFRKPDGGFTNGWVCRLDEKVYSVATASSALSFGIFGTLTDNPEYIRIAEQAACFLAEQWNDDGRLWNHIYQGTYPGHDHYQDVREFGDGLYTLETICAVLAISKERVVRVKLFGALKKYLFGSSGLLNLKGGAAWWPLQNNWHNSKSTALPLLLQTFVQYGRELGATDEELHAAEETFLDCRAFLCLPSSAKLLGVAADDTDRAYPFASHSIQSWTGCSAAATGFAGIALAQMISPGIAFCMDGTQ